MEGECQCAADLQLMVSNTVFASKLSRNKPTELIRMVDVQCYCCCGRSRKHVSAPSYQNNLSVLNIGNTKSHITVGSTQIFQVSHFDLY